jgi:hypothetical protein
MKTLLIISAVLLVTIAVNPARSQVFFRSLPHQVTCTPSPTSAKLPSCASWRAFILKASCSTACTYVGNKCMDCEGHACSTC